MAGLTKQEILHIAKLAQLNLTPAEIEKYAVQLSNVIKHIDQLSEVNTEGVEPASQTTGLENVTRMDEIKNDVGLTQEQATSGSDKIYNGYFKVKAILENRTDK